MPTCCVAPQCKSGYRSEKKNNPDAKYGWHKFPPSGSEERKKWLAVMPRINDGGKCYDPPKDARLCHKHFLPSDYEEKHQSRNSTHRNSNRGIITGCFKAKYCIECMAWLSRAPFKKDNREAFKNGHINSQGRE